MPTLAVAQYGLAPALASALLHSLWESAALAVAAALLLGAMSRSSAAARHNVAMLFLIAMALLPLARFLGFWAGPAADNAGLIRALTGSQLSAAGDGFRQHTSPLTAFIVIGWLGGALIMLVRHIAGLRALAAMDRVPHQSLPAEWQARLDRMGVAMGITRKVAVRISDEVLSPFAARLVRPVIWLPLSLVTGAPREHLEALLAHELAHIARKDWLWNGVQCLIEALLFFNPAVWWLSRRIRQEREHACDDLAVTACGDAIALAEALARLECERHPSPRIALAAQGGSLVHRIGRLLSASPTRGRWPAIAVLGSLTVAGAMVLTQVELSGGRFPDLEVTSSTDGPLGPGDYREIKANGLDKARYYRASVDDRGRMTQIYRENGEARPIDAGVQRWIDQVSRMSATISPAAIAKLHELPASARIEEQPEMKSLLSMISSRPEVVAKVGSPATPSAEQVQGNVTIGDGDGEADVNIEVTGPKGAAVVHASGELRGGSWTLGNLDVR